VVPSCFKINYVGDHHGRYLSGIGLFLPEATCHWPTLSEHEEWREWRFVLGRVTEILSDGDATLMSKFSTRHDHMLFVALLGNCKVDAR